MKTSKSTIIRTVLMGVVILNMVLKSLGYSVINVSESEIATLVEYGIEIAVLVVNWWYNNSFTPEAKIAQTYLKKLKEEKE